VYNNSFSSVFEYEEAFQLGKIDWASAVGKVCPLCGRADCLRRIKVVPKKKKKKRQS